jgi:hypothetical protein
MSLRVCSLLLITCIVAALRAADEPQPKTNMKDAISARLAQEAKQGGAKPVGPGKSQTATDAAKTEPAPAVPAPVNPSAAKDSKSETAATAEAKKEAPTILPKVEVKKSRITELDQKLHEQEADMAREKKNTVPTEMDKALNDSKVAKALSIFGGQSEQYRANISTERVSMMEEEKDLIEAIAHAKTKAEKKELQKQLDELKKMRRELERSLK